LRLNSNLVDAESGEFIDKDDLILPYTLATVSLSFLLLLLPLLEA